MVTYLFLIKFLCFEPKKHEVSALAHPVEETVTDFFSWKMQTLSGFDIAGGQANFRNSEGFYI